MKKLFMSVVLVCFVAGLLSAAAPVPPATQLLKGALKWQPASVCGVSDYVTQSTLTNVYLTGKFKPTRGILQGCQVSASGFRYQAGSCNYFFVYDYKVSCLTSSTTVTTR